MRFSGLRIFGCLAHEAHPGDHHGRGRVLAAEAGHFQRVGHAAAGFLGQSLDDRIGVVVGDQHGVVRLELGGDRLAVVGDLLFGQRAWAAWHPDGPEPGVVRKSASCSLHLRVRVREPEYTPVPEPSGRFAEGSETR